MKRRTICVLVVLVVTTIWVTNLVRDRILEKNINYRLCYAAEEGQTATVQRLLGQGASPNAYLDHYVDAGMHDGRLDQAPALTLAVFNDDAPTVAVLLKAGADPNARDPQGRTSLMWTRGNISIIKLLLAHGANVNGRDKNGETVLSNGTLNRQTKQILLNAGARQ